MKRFTQFLILVFIAILIIPAFLPDKIEASVEKDFHYPVETLFRKFNNLNEFAKWEPWASGDSLTKQDFFSPYKGKGAGYQWSSKEKKGILTITDVADNKIIEYTLEGYDLSKGSKMIISFTPTDSSAVKVNWTVESGKIGYFSRYYSYFTSENLKNKMNEGLDKLEKILKKSEVSKPKPNPVQISTETFKGLKLIGIINETTLDEDEMKTAFDESRGLLFSYLTDFLKISEKDLGNPVVYFEYIDKTKGKAKFSFGYPTNKSIKLGEGMSLIDIPASKTLIATHKGSFETAEETLNQMREYAKKNNLNLSNAFWQEFPNGYQSLPNKDEVESKIYIPIKK